MPIPPTSRPRRLRATLPALLATLVLAVGAGPFTAIAHASERPPARAQQPTPRGVVGVIAIAPTTRGAASTTATSSASATPTCASSSSRTRRSGR
jgi:hypothetical protein